MFIRKDNNEFSIFFLIIFHKKRITVPDYIINTLEVFLFSFVFFYFVSF